MQRPGDSSLEILRVFSPRQALGLLRNGCGASQEDFMSTEPRVLDSREQGIAIHSDPQTATRGQLRHFGLHAP